MVIGLKEIFLPTAKPDAGGVVLVIVDTSMAYFRPAFPDLHLEAIISICEFRRRKVLMPKKQATHSRPRTSLSKIHIALQGGPHTIAPDLTDKELRAMNVRFRAKSRLHPLTQSISAYDPCGL